MPTSEHESLIREKLGAALKALVNINPKDLTREAELGTKLSFTEALPSIERIIGLYKRIETISFDTVSYEALAGVNSGATDALNLFKSIQEFNPQQGPNPNEARKRIIDAARDQYGAHYARVSPVLAFANQKEANFNELEQKARAALDSVNKLAAEITKKGKDLGNSAEGILNNLQETAAKLGAGQHSISFKLQSDEHKIVARVWLGITIFAVAAGMYAVWYFFLGPMKVDVEKLTTGQAIYLVASRLMLFSIISFIIYWAAKNHGAHQHNYVINKHRQNALSTFQTFVEAAGSDQSVKNAVLLQAGHAIYGQQCTGYSEGVSAPATPINFIEVVKNAAGK